MSTYEDEEVRNQRLLEETGRSTIPTGLAGQAGSKVLESIPTYVRADNEHIITSANGAYIITGRDRPGSRISGLGHLQGSARIDMCVGRTSALGVRGTDRRGKKMFVDNSFEHDAARIYMSQLSNIDDYFRLVPGSMGMSKYRSAIGIKADAVRIMAREGIKLVTRPEPKNSHGKEIKYVRGIDLIAGNDATELQPLVKGHSLMKVLDEIVDWIGKLNSLIDSILLEQMQMNTAVAAHVHEVVPVPGVPGAFMTTPDVKVLAPVTAKCQSNLAINCSVPLKLHRMNGIMMKMNSIKTWGRNHILSRHNNTN